MIGVCLKGKNETLRIEHKARVFPWKRVTKELCRANCHSTLETQTSPPPFFSSSFFSQEDQPLCSSALVFFRHFGSKDPLQACSLPLILFCVLVGPFTPFFLLPSSVLSMFKRIAYTRFPRPAPPSPCLAFSLTFYLLYCKDFFTKRNRLRVSRLQAHFTLSLSALYNTPRFFTIQALL